MGEIAILSVGAGDTKLTFDNKNPAETIRAARIVTDMLRRGYALLVEVEQPDGTSAFQRVREFREDTCEYVIADFDPTAPPDKPTSQDAQYVPPPRYGGKPDEEAGEAAASSPEAGNTETAPPRPKRGRPRTRTIPATGPTRAVAIARSAGG
jgi:hypothetical protein